MAFSEKVCRRSYLYSKNRAKVNLRDNANKSYGIREEHRVSLQLLEVMEAEWEQLELYGEDDNDQGGPLPLPLPYYIIPTADTLQFLRAQINKYCFLFEHTLAATAKTHSLPEFVMMVLGLRALRFCYGSSLLPAESLLYNDKWTKKKKKKKKKNEAQGDNARGDNAQGDVVKEGMGMKKSIQSCGIGWFLPKIDWGTWRLLPPHNDNMLTRNLHVHDEYKRQWRAVRDLQDVWVRLN